METMFVLSPVIIRNFSEKTLNRFLYENRLHAEYTRSGKQYCDFVQEYINNGTLSSFELGELLYNDLLYGSQRLIFMYKICSYNSQIQSKQSLLEILQDSYVYVDSLNVNKILYQPYNEEIEDLVGVKVVLGIDGSSIRKINLIFSEKCTLTDSTGIHSEYSYITIDIDLIQKLLFVKVKPKSNLSDETKKPTNIAEKYFNKISKKFDISYHDFKGIHKQTLCNMNIELYEQIYQKMVQTKPKDLQEFINRLSNEIITKIGITDYYEKVADNNIFNIPDTLAKMIEHILISNILYKAGADDTLEGVDGYVSYIKFSDGTNISARLRSENYVEPIFSSEAYMALRSSINNAKKIAVLKVFWLNHFFGLRVSYDASNDQYLNILLYQNHKKEEFEYAIKQYCECESRTIEPNTGFFALEA